MPRHPSPRRALVAPRFRPWAWLDTAIAENLRMLDLGGDEHR